MILVHRCIIVPDAYAPMAGALTSIATPAGAGMFIQGLSTEDAVTHRFSNGLIDEKFTAILPLDQWDEDTQEYVRVSLGSAVFVAAMSGDPEAKAILNPPPEPVEGEPEPEPEPGTYITIAQVEGLFAAAVVTSEDWATTAGRLGLENAG